VSSQCVVNRDTDTTGLRRGAEIDDAIRDHDKP
jgi:hypothetical protein